MDHADIAGEGGEGGAGGGTMGGDARRHSSQQHYPSSGQMAAGSSSSLPSPSAAVLNQPSSSQLTTLHNHHQSYGNSVLVLTIKTPFDVADEQTTTTAAPPSSPAPQFITKPKLLSVGQAVVIPPDSKRWIPDSHADQCMAPGCQQPFTMFNRKHHCRICGLLFCANCSANSILLENNSDNISAPSPTSTATPLPLPNNNSNSGQFIRVCNQCYYEHQLVISRRDPHSSLKKKGGGGGGGELRKRCRGELKMLQRAVLARMLSYLSISDLAEASCASSDFYFIARDNIVWFGHNNYGPNSTISNNSMTTSTMKNNNSYYGSKQQQQQQQQQQQGVSGGGGVGNNSRQQEQPTTSKSSSSTGSSSSSSSPISHHSTYNFTQFLQYTHRVENARLKGFSTFATSIKQLFSNPIKIAVVGPSGIGKTKLIQNFVGDLNTVLVPNQYATTGLTTYNRRVNIMGGLTSEGAPLTIYDVGGDDRYEHIRNLCVSCCHAVILCYDTMSKMSMVRSATIMNALEQDVLERSHTIPVVCCGIYRPGVALCSSSHLTEVGGGGSKRRSSTNSRTEIGVVRSKDTSVDTAKELTPRCRGSVQVNVNSGGVAAFEAVVQSLVDKLGHSNNQRTVECLLQLSTNPSVLDILLDTQ